MLVERSTSGGKAFFREEPVVELAPASGLPASASIVHSPFGKALQGIRDNEAR
jgi:hypothetical protein